MKPFVFTKILQILGLAVLAFVLLRIVGPWLIDLHDTGALVLAAVLLLGGALLLAWFAWKLVTSPRSRDIDNA